MTKRPLLLVLALYLLLTIAYGVVNPLFEAPDELWHYFTAQYIAETKQLPQIEADYDPWLSQEAAQPPLYYLTGAVLIAPIDTSHARQEVWLNPHFPRGIGNAAALANKNIAVHTAREAWPWRGYVLAAHGLRLFSTLLGMGTLLCIYGSGRLLWPNQPKRALLATAVIAFLPQYNFLHASISNDTLVIFLCSLTIWQLLRLWPAEPTRLQLLLLGITIGLAALSKTAGILLLLFALGVMFLQVVARFQPLDWKAGRQLLRSWLLVIIPVLLLAGPLWWRNWGLYGDPTAANQFVLIAGGDRGFTLSQVLAETPGLWVSLFGVFGWFNIRAPFWFYLLWSGIIATAVIGSIWYAGRQALSRDRETPRTRLLSNMAQPVLWAKPAGWLVVWPLLVYAGLLRFMLQTPAAQGRLLFPAIVPFALAVAFGLDQWTKIKYWVPLLAMGSSVFCLTVVIPPVYASPPTLTTLPDSAEPVKRDVGQGLSLIGIEKGLVTAVPGQAVKTTLYWQADPVPQAAPDLVVELFGRENALLGKQQSYHGRGLYPANGWSPGEIVADRVGYHITDTVAAPVLARLVVNLADGVTGQEAGAVKIVPRIWPAPAGPALARIDEKVSLTAVAVTKGDVQPGTTLTVTVQWHVLAAPGRDFTTFVHLAAAGQPPLATGDSPPLAGSYPTRVWAAREVIDDTYVVVIPATLENGRYPLWLGWYAPDSGVRLPLTIDGTRQPHDAFLAGWVEVKEDD